MSQTRTPGKFSALISRLLEHCRRPSLSVAIRRTDPQGSSRPGAQLGSGSSNMARGGGQRGRARERAPRRQETRGTWSMGRTEIRTGHPLPIFVPDQHLSLNQAHRRQDAYLQGASRVGNHIRGFDTRGTACAGEPLGSACLPLLPTASRCPIGKGSHSPAGAGCYSWLSMCAPPSSHSPTCRAHLVPSQTHAAPGLAWPLVPKHVAFRAGQRLK